MDANGTLTAIGGIYTTAGGADICSSTGTGVYNQQGTPGTETKTYQYTQKGSVTAHEIPITAAKLHNADGTYTETATANTGDVINYVNGVWCGEAPTELTVTFEANGSAEYPVKGTMTPQTVNAKTDTALNANSFTREGYNFLNWNTAADGTGDSYADGATVNLTENTTLYAQWTQDPVITFDKNDGSGTAATQTVPYGESATLNANSFTRTGYTFTGWNTKADGSGTAYGDGASVSLSSNVTLYAQWQLNTYSYSFDANGGSGSMSGGSAAYGESIQLPGNTFTRPKYTFTGWNTRADGSGTAYTDNASLTLTEDTTLYAQWILVTDYTILLPDGDNITVDPATKIGSAQIGIQSGSTIPEEKQLQMSVNAGTHYDDAAQCYRLLNSTGVSCCSTRWPTRGTK